MGLFDNISSGLGSLASEVSPRNTAADMAMIEYNEELRKDNAARWAQSANLSQTEYDRDIKLAIQKNKQDGFLPSTFENQEDFDAFINNWNETTGAGSQMGRLSYSQIKRFFGQEKANRFLNDSGFAPSYFGEFGGSGKRLDEVNTVSAIGTGEYEGQSGINPAVRTVRVGDDGQSPQLYTANATRGGVPVSQLAAQGGDEAVDQESVGFIDDVSVDRMLEDYHRELDKRAGLRSDIRGLRETTLIPWGGSREEKDLAAAEIAAESSASALRAAEESRDAYVTETDALLEEQDAAAAKTKEEKEAKVTNLESDLERSEGEGFTVQYKGQDERTLLMGDDLFNVLPSVKTESWGQAGEVGSFVEHNSKSNAWTETFLWDERVNPFNLTNAQWNSLNGEQQDKVRNAARQLTQDNIEDKNRLAKRTLAKQLAAKRKEGGLTKEERDEIEKVKKYYKDDAPDIHTDDFWVKNPDKFQQYIKDPLGYGLENYDTTMETEPKDPVGTQVAKDATPTNVTPKVEEQFTRDIRDQNLESLNKTIAGLKETSVEANENLAQLIQQKAANGEKWEKDQRAQVGLNFLAATRDDSDLMRVVLGAIPTFMETGDFSTFQEELQLSYDQLQVKKDTNKIARDRLQNDIQRQADVGTITSNFQNDFSDRVWEILNDTETPFGPQQIGVIGGLFENQIGVITNKLNAALSRGVNSQTGLLNAQTEYEEANTELDSAMKITMQALNDYITAQSQPGLWEELLTLGFASGAGEQAFDVNPNIVPVDKNGKPTSDVKAFADGGGFMQLRANGTLVSLAGGKRGLANSKLSDALGNKGMKLLFGVALPNYYTHYGAKK